MFTAVHAQITLQMQVERSRRVCEAVARGETDVALVGGEVPTELCDVLQVSVLPHLLTTVQFMIMTLLSFNRLHTTSRMHARKHARTQARTHSHAQLPLTLFSPALDPFLDSSTCALGQSLRDAGSQRDCTNCNPALHSLAAWWSAQRAWSDSEAVQHN